MPRSLNLPALAALVLLCACGTEAQEPSGEGAQKTTTAQHSTPEAEPDPETDPEPEPTPARASDASWDPDSIHVLVNRLNPLEPADYAPEDLAVPQVRTSVEVPLYLRQEAAGALEELFAAIEAEGMSLALTSAYRSFEVQARVYWDRHAVLGTAATDEFAARPGYSEHQTGLAADVISIDNPECITGDCFAETPEGAWVAQNSHRFGYLVRYLEGAEHITGYAYEPWHLRYVGVQTAEEVFGAGITLEEYWDQPAAPDYDQPEPSSEQLTQPDG